MERAIIWAFIHRHACDSALASLFVDMHVSREHALQHVPATVRLSAALRALQDSQFTYATRICKICDPFIKCTLHIF